jgi:hypothetical protein
MPEDVEKIVRKLGAAQRRTVLSLTGEWGAAASHQAAKRLWYRTDIPLLLDHKHRTDNCRALRPIGLAVRAHLLSTSNGDSHGK